MKIFLLLHVWNYCCARIVKFYKISTNTTFLQSEHVSIHNKYALKILKNSFFFTAEKRSSKSKNLLLYFPYFSLLLWSLLIIFPRNFAKIENTIFLFEIFWTPIKFSNKSESSIDYKTKEKGENTKKKDNIKFWRETRREAKASGAQLTSGPFLFIDFPAGMFIGDRRNPRNVTMGISLTDNRCPCPRLILAPRKIAIQPGEIEYPFGMR